MEKRKDMRVNERRPWKVSINNNKIRNKKRISINFRKIVDYLKSDSYFYSQLISSSVPFDSSASHNVFIRDKPLLAKKDQVKEKLIEYLRSDTYLYAPLEGTKHRHHLMMKSVISSPRGQELQFARVSGRVFSREITWQTKKVAEESIKEKFSEEHGSRRVPLAMNFESPRTPALEEVKKKAVRRSNRLSTIPD